MREMNTINFSNGLEVGAVLGSVSSDSCYVYPQHVSTGSPVKIDGYFKNASWFFASATLQFYFDAILIYEGDWILLPKEMGKLTIDHTIPDNAGLGEHEYAVKVKDEVWSDRKVSIVTVITIEQEGEEGFGDVTSLEAPNSADPNDTLGIKVTIQNAGAVADNICGFVYTDDGVVLLEVVEYLEPGASMELNANKVMPDKNLIITAQGYHWSD